MIIYLLGPSCEDVDDYVRSDVAGCMLRCDGHTVLNPADYTKSCAGIGDSIIRAAMIDIADAFVAVDGWKSNPKAHSDLRMFLRKRRNRKIFWGWEKVPRAEVILCS